MRIGLTNGWQGDMTARTVMPAHPLRSVIAETGVANAWPVGRMPLAVAFAHGVDGVNQAPDSVSTLPPDGDHVGLLASWSCGGLAAAVGRFGAQWVINIHLPSDAMRPATPTAVFEYGLCAYIGLRLHGVIDYFRPSLCDARDPNFEALDVTIDGSAPHPFGAYIESYWSAVAADLLAQSGVTRQTFLPIEIARTIVSRAHVMKRFRRTRYAQTLAALRAAGGAVRAKVLSDDHAHAVADYEMEVRRLLPMMRSGRSRKTSAMPDATARARQAVVERLVAQYFPSFCNEESGIAGDLQKLESQLRGILKLCGGVQMAPFLALLLKSTSEQIRDAFPGVTPAQHETALTGVVTALRYETDAPEDGEPSTWYVMAQAVVADRLTAIDRAMWQEIAANQLRAAGVALAVFDAAVDHVVAGAYATQTLTAEAIAEMRRRAEAHAIRLAESKK